MKYNKENNMIEVYFSFKGEDFNVGYIKNDITEYVFTNILFAHNDTITDKNLEYLKLKIEEYYSNNDSIGRIESKYPYYFP